MLQRGKIALLSCDSGKPLAHRIFKHLEKIYRNDSQNKNIDHENHPNLVNSEEIWFPNGEVKTVILENIRGDDLYVLQSIADPLSQKTVNDNFLALLTAIDAAYQSDVDQITAVVPYYSYSRQERKKTRECITARVIAECLEISKAIRVITVDVHSEAIVGFFRRIKLENLHASRLIIDHVNECYPDLKFTVVAPDVGSANRARFFSREFGSELAIIDKERNYKTVSTVENMRLVGQVEDQNIFMGDDILGTGNTLIRACQLLKERQAKDIYLACTFPFFNGTALENFQKAYEQKLIQKVIGTDCVFWGEEFIQAHPWYEEISVSKLVAEVIYNINHKRSVSELLK